MTDEQHAAEVLAANKASDAQRMHLTDHTWMISPKEAADIACQNAFRLSRNNATKMREILQNELNNSIFAKTPRSGGAFQTNHPNNCHPNVPGINYYMAKWSNAYLQAICDHIRLIK